ncbi:MAG: hypothetical protein P9L96_00650 [Candidatus Gygaella obscura]|nr:hypothetical protein [Candidatus Gygaella obscura]
MDNCLEVCQKVIDRINKEKPNFEFIIEKRSYNSEDHRKAVEVCSYELLKKEIVKLKKISKFNNDVSEVLDIINKKEPDLLLNRLNELEKKINKYLVSLKKPKEEIFFLKPNFYGIGMDVKTFFKRIFNKF